GNGVHEVFSADSFIVDGDGRKLVTGYAVRRPDGQWSIMLINKDPKSAHQITVEFAGSQVEAARHFDGPVELFSYSGRQFVWKADGEHGHSVRNLPPEHLRLPRLTAEGIELPPYSLTVLRGRLSAR